MSLQPLFQKDPSSKKLAELFYYLNRTGYNGLCRFNNQGEFNVPFGKYKVINYKKDFLVYKKLYKQCGFKLKFLNNAPRRISCTGDRSPAKEVMALHNLI